MTIIANQYGTISGCLTQPFCTLVSLNDHATVIKQLHLPVWRAGPSIPIDVAGAVPRAKPSFDEPNHYSFAPLKHKNGKAGMVKKLAEPPSSPGGSRPVTPQKIQEAQGFPRAQKAKEASRARREEIDAHRKRRR